METYIAENGQLVVVNTVETKQTYSLESLVSEKVSLEERLKVIDALISKVSEMNIKTETEIANTITEAQNTLNNEIV